MSKYAKREVFEAIQFTGKSKFEKLLAFLEGRPFQVLNENQVLLTVEEGDTLGEVLDVNEGDFLVQGKHGLLVLEPEAFKAKYKKLRS